MLLMFAGVFTLLGALLRSHVAAFVLVYGIALVATFLTDRLPVVVGHGYAFYARQDHLLYFAPLLIGLVSLLVLRLVARRITIASE